MTTNSVASVVALDRARAVLSLRVNMDRCLREMVRYDAPLKVKLKAHDEFMGLVEELNDWAGTWEFDDGA